MKCLLAPGESLKFFNSPHPLFMSVDLTTLVEIQEVFANKPLGGREFQLQLYRINWTIPQCTKKGSIISINDHCPNFSVVKFNRSINFPEMNLIIYCSCYLNINTIFVPAVLRK